jgi:hypothetical protein
VKAWAQHRKSNYTKGYKIVIFEQAQLEVKIIKGDSKAIVF